MFITGYDQFYPVEIADEDTIEIAVLYRGRLPGSSYLKFEYNEQSSKIVNIEIQENVPVSVLSQCINIQLDK